MLIVGLDVGSTTVKASVVEDGAVRWKDYKRHNTKQAEMVLEFLGRMQAECGLTAGRDRIFLTGSGGSMLAPHLGGKMIQEVVAVAAAVEKLHPGVNFVSEIGGEDMKTLFFTPSGDGKAKQVYMQSACSGGTGTFIEKTARKLQIEPERLAQMDYAGLELHKISSKCGIFAEADANTLVKAGVPVEEIIASLYEAVVYQNLATLTKGNTPTPQVLLLGGPNLFFRGLQAGVEAPPRQALGRAQGAGAARRRSAGHDPGAEGGALLRVPRLRRDRRGRSARGRRVRRHRQTEGMDRERPVGAEGARRRQGAGEERR